MKPFNWINHVEPGVATVGADKEPVGITGIGRIVMKQTRIEPERLVPVGRMILPRILPAMQPAVQRNDA